ncbi:MAG: ABC transporter ATP-binding protein [Clostridiales bacterium]|nr:MAG: ABC transporter ATP-binding protein [Clostridiales bacterium]
MLSVKNYTKTYDGKKNVVENVTFEVNSGDIFGFIGHNGAGKTTTIKSCVGILDFEGGEISINGNSIKTDPLKCKKDIAYLPDNPDLYEFMTGIKYLNFIADIYSVPTQTRNELIKKYGDAFEFSNSLTAGIDTYSHGMKQKLAIIGALIHSPKLLICDEPFVGLDPKSALAFKNIMHEMCDRGGAVLFSTHVLEVAEKLCNRIAIIMHGKLVACGSIDEVKGTASLEDVFMELVNE